MKSNNPNNYKLINSIFKKYCEENDLDPYINAVTFEHEGFSCAARDTFYGDDKYFRAVDACCSMCGTVDYCFACGRYCQIDFEEV